MGLCMHGVGTKLLFVEIVSQNCILGQKNKQVSIVDRQAVKYVL